MRWEFPAVRLKEAGRDCIPAGMVIHQIPVTMAGARSDLQKMGMVYKAPGGARQVGECDAYWRTPVSAREPSSAPV